MSIVDPLPFMIRYLDGTLTNDEREVLLFALYLESLSRGDGLANKGLALCDAAIKKERLVK